MDPNQQNQNIPNQIPTEPTPIDPAASVTQPSQDTINPYFNYQQPATPTSTNLINQTQTEYQAPTNQVQPQQPILQKPNNNSKKIIIGISIVIALIVISIASIFGVKWISDNFMGLELEKYTNSNFGFTMEVPKNWKIEETDKSYSREVDFVEPVGDLKDKSKSNEYTSQINVSYEKNDSEYDEIDEDDFFESVKKSIQSGVKDQNEEEDESDSSSSYKKELYSVEKEEKTTINGIKAYKVKLKVTNYDNDKGEIGYTYLSFMYIDKNNQFMTAINAHESELINKKADTIINSFTKK